MNNKKNKVAFIKFRRMKLIIICLTNNLQILIGGKCFPNDRKCTSVKSRNYNQIIIL